MLRCWWLVLFSVCIATRLASAKSLPEGKLIVAYATHCDAKVIEEVSLGVNVLIWFAASLGKDAQGNPSVLNGFDSQCIAQTAKTLAEKGLETAHLMSIGGWNAPHPDTAWTGAEWWEVWKKWNQGMAHPELGFHGFDGIDWDLEGNDKVSSPWNHFTAECMDLVGTMSQAAKQDGFVVTLVPPQSYFDATTSKFDLSLLHAYSYFHPEFAYHGFNAYALWWTKYGMANATLPTFDFVDIQFYESYSPADYSINGRGQNPAEYITGLVRQLAAGWTVDFSSVPEVAFPSTTVAVPAPQLVIGFARGGENGRSVFVWPSSVGEAFASLGADAPRGVMFWNVENDGGEVNGTSTTCSYATEFNKFLHIRAQPIVE